MEYSIATGDNIIWAATQDKVRRKPACTATKTSLKISLVASLDMMLSD